MVVPQLDVIPKELNFKSNEKKTVTVILKTPNVFTSFNVELSHNLPECFKVEPSTGSIVAPRLVTVTYDPSLNSQSETLSQAMNIKFTSSFQECVQVLVKFSTSEITSDALECKVCLIHFSEDIEDQTPLILIGCGHTICKKCVETFKSRSKTSEILCPFDRKPTNLSNSTLPKNFSMIEMLREDKTSKIAKKLADTKIIDNPDVPCYENSEHESTCYCTSCKIELCEDCFKSVHSSKILSSHQSIPISERPVILPNCGIHSTSLVYYLCTDESCKIPTKLFCDDCRTDDHKTHEHQNLIESIVKNQEELGDTVNKLKSSEIKFQVKLESTKISAKLLEKTNPVYTEKVARVIKHFDDKKQEALRKLEKHVDLEKEKMENEGDEMEHGLRMIVETRREIEKLLKRKANLHLVEEIIEKAKVLCALEAGSESSETGYVPFTINSLPDDMSTISYPVSIAPTAAPPVQQREVITRVVERRYITARRMK